nr:MAG TPA: hypothetical protein [Caudoviricetes sp.]
MMLAPRQGLFPGRLYAEHDTGTRLVVLQEFRATL